MPKSKKSDSEKAAKDKEPKALKAGKADKEKKEKKAKDKAPKAGKKAPAPKKEKAGAGAVEITISNDDISLRAYFIAERRQAMGWPGDSTSDWVEAERQLKAEAARKAKK